MLDVPAATGEWFERAEEEERKLIAGEPIVTGLSYDDFRVAYQAIAFANCFGWMVDSRVDVSWSTVGIRGELDVRRAQQALIEAVDLWCERHNLPLALLWVLEVGARFELHSHFMLHVPNAYAVEFTQFCQAQIRLIAGRIVNTAEVRTLNVEIGDGDLASQWARFKYMMKGVSIHATLPRGGGDDFIPLRAFAELEGDSQGRIEGQRMGTSPDVAPAILAQYQSELPDMTLRVDGPQLYGDTFLNWHKARLKQPHFRGSLAPRDARHLNVAKP